MLAPRIFLAVLLSLILVAPGIAWDTNGTPICTAPGKQSNQATVSDGAGGWYLAWMDERQSEPHIYAVRVTHNGSVAPGWIANGTPICSAAVGQRDPHIIADGSGGLFVAWTDLRSGDADVYVQHVDGTGMVLSGWPAQGKAVCLAIGSQSVGDLASDGNGGVFVAWHDARANPSFSLASDIYAQRLTGDGISVWQANGVPICVTPDDERGEIHVEADGAGGFYVAWNDCRGASGCLNVGAYLQHVTAIGGVVANWPEDGRLLSGPGDSNLESLAADGVGGAFVGWSDGETGQTRTILQRVTGAGDIGTGWSADGVVLAVKDSISVSLDVIPTSGGDVLALFTFTGEATRLQRLTSSGSIAPGWPVDGVQVCVCDGNATVGTVVYPQSAVARDGAGGLLFHYSTFTPGLESDLFVNRVTSDGTIALGWTEDRSEVCTGCDVEDPHVLAADGLGGSLLSWEDFRNGEGDIYASFVAGDGDVVPALISLVRTEAEPDHVRLVWFAATGDLDDATVYRRSAERDWAVCGQVGADGTGYLTFDDRDVEPGKRYGYRLGLQGAAGERLAGEVWITVPDQAGLSLAGLIPNPGGTELVVSCTLGSSQSATLDLLDVAGRRVLSHEFQSPRRGSHIVNLGTRAGITSGTYVLRLVQGDNAVVRKAVIVR